jgi:uncharacterized protein YggE
MTDSPRVVARGEAVTEVPPDAADLVVTVRVREHRRERAPALLAERQRELTAPLAGHRDALGTVSTDAVAVFPEFPDGGRISGHLATTTTRVQLEDVTAAGELADAVARARAYAAAPGCRLTGLVEVRDVGTGGGPMSAAFTLDTAAPQLELQPAAQEVRGQVEVTVTMSEPDQEVFTR